MRYDPSTDHDPMFDVPPAQGGGSEMRAKTRSTPSVTRGNCPDCATVEPTGIIRQGEHLAWRLHHRTMLSGARLECRASGAPICQAKPRPVTGITTPACTCEAKA